VSLNAKRILSTVLGLVLSGMGGFFLFLEMNSPPAHSTHIYVFSGFIAVGCFIIAPGVIGSALQRVVGLIPSVTIATGGRRASDPPIRPPAKDVGEN
jgi:ABC-type uncharacterized transport system permease subunit